VKNLWAEKHYAQWWKERFPGRRINAMTPASLEDAMRALTADNLAPQTIVHYMKYLRHVLNVAVRDGKLEKTPFSKVTLPKVRTGRTRFLSLDEERTILEKLGPIYAPWARLAILTGMRQGEQFNLKWQDLNLEQGFITLPDTKAGMVQYIPLSEEAKKILRGMHAIAEAEAIADPRKRSEWVFPSENRATAMDARNFYIRIYLPAVEAAMLKGLTWHALRHTFASRLAMSGKAESTIAALPSPFHYDASKAVCPSLPVSPQGSGGGSHRFRKRRGNERRIKRGTDGHGSQSNRVTNRNRGKQRR